MFIPVIVHLHLHFCHYYLLLFPQSELFKFSNPKPKQPSVPATKTPAVNFSATSPKMPFNPVASPPKAEPMEDEIEVIDDEDEENQDFGGGGFKVAKELKKGSCLDFLGIGKILFLYFLCT